MLLSRSRGRNKNVKIIKKRTKKRIKRSPLSYLLDCYSLIFRGQHSSKKLIILAISIPLHFVGHFISSISEPTITILAGNVFSWYSQRNLSSERLSTLIRVNYGALSSEPVFFLNPVTHCKVVEAYTTSFQYSFKDCSGGGICVMK